MKLFSGTRAMVLVAGLAVCGAVAPIATAAGTMASQPEPATPTLQQAGALFAQQKYAEAAKLYRQITEAQPENAQAWFQLGYCLHVTGNLEEAIPAHKKAASLAPDRSQFKVLGLYNLGCAYSLQGKKDAAFEALMRAVDAGFHTQQNIGIVSTDPDLDAIRDDARFAKFAGAMQEKARSDTLKQFDFWVGKWDVYNKDGRLIGKNVIESVQNGLVLVEHWTSAVGNTGRSMNYFEPVSRVWKQVWVDGDYVLETSGKWEDGALRFRGEAKTRQGQVKQHRMVFTPDERGRVRQVIHSSDDGEAWEEDFAGLYVPAGSESPGAWGSEARAAGASAGVAPAGARVLAGVWDMIVEQEQDVEIEVILTFSLEQGVVRGVADAMGAQMALEEIALKDGELTMRLTAPDAQVYTFKGVVAGNAIKGAWTNEAGEETAASARRADI